MQAPCHPSRRLYAKRRCRSCYEKHLRATNPSFTKRQRANARAWHSANPERIAALRQKRAAFNRTPAGKLRRRELYLRREYGITLEDYNGLLSRQGGRCRICLKKYKLHVDHNHKTGRVRGLLCFRCNFGLGWWSEQPARLQRALDYLKEDHK